MIMLTNPYLIALGIPLILVFCGALAKKLVRGDGWHASDFFLGVELVLASLGSAMVHFFDLQKGTLKNPCSILFMVMLINRAFRMP